MSDRPYLRDQSEPLTDETDAFGHRDYATALTHALTASEPPFTVGLFGAWGIGKTTILGEVRRQVKAAGCTYVSFDAWRYEGEAFRREFLRDVAKKLKASDALTKKFDPDGDLQDLYTTRASPDEQVIVSKAHIWKALISWGALAGVLYVAGVLSVNALLASQSKTDPAIVAALALLPLMFFLINKTTDIIQIRQHVVTRQRLEEPERFSERFAALLRAVTARRVVIAIDNLDRLSADDAVALLSTIKTYLEPVIEEEEAAPLGDVVFLIAADDLALREHLMTRAPQGVDEATPGRARRKAERYADDYLRKFFNTSLSLRPVLDDDIRDYMRKHLARLAERWERPQQLENLVRLCAAGLRHNPRRIKQFVNDLELQLQLILAREAGSASHASKIEPPISHQLDVIAKLALIDEEWPEPFEAIRKQPGLLRAWEEIAWTKGEKPESWLGGGWDEFSAFLRASSHVSTPSLRPFLRLKRSLAESTLPRYDEFHDAVTTPDDQDAVRELLTDLPDDMLDAYADRLPDIGEEELKAGNLDGAIAVVSIAVSVEEFVAREASRTRVLMHAVREPDLRAALTRLPPTALLQATGALQATTRAAIHEVLIEHLMTETVPPDGTTELARALAGVAHEFAPHIAGQFRTSLDEQQERGALFAHYLPLMQARPDLLSAGIAQRALAALTKARVGDKPHLGETGAQWGVVQAATSTGVLAAVEEDALIDHIIQALAHALGDAAATQALLDDLASLARMKNATAEAWQRLFGQLIKQTQGTPSDTRDLSTTLAADMLDRVPVEQRPQLASQLSQQMFAPPAFGIAYVNDHAEALPDDLRTNVGAMLEHRLKTGHLDAADALLQVDRDAGSARIATAAVNAANEVNHNLLTGLLDGYPEHLSQETRGQIAASALARLQQPLPPGAAEPDIELLVRLAPELGADQRDSVAALAARYVQQKQPAFQASADKLVALVSEEPSFALQVRAVLDQVVPHFSNPDAPLVQPHFGFLVSHFASLNTVEQDQVLASINRWLRQNTDSQYLASVVQRLPKLPPQKADDLARALKEAELAQDATAHAARVELVVAVRAVASATDGKRATDQSDALMESLRKGDEHQRAVYDGVLGREAA